MPIMKLPALLGISVILFAIGFIIFGVALAIGKARSKNNKDG